MVEIKGGFSMSKVTPEMVEKALASLDATLGEEIVSKASENDLDQPEGADLGNPAKEKMSDEAKAAKAKADAEEGIKKGKEEPATEEDESEEGEEGGEDLEMSKKAVKKSELPEEIQTKIDVSEFLKSLVDHTTEAIDTLAESVIKSEEASNTKFEALSNSIVEIQKSQAKIGLVLKALCEQAGILASAPKRVVKSETTLAKSAVAERSFAQEPVENAGEEKMFKSLSDNPMMAKSQITEALIDLVKSNKCTDMDLINFESTSYLRPEVVEHLKMKLN